MWSLQFTDKAQVSKVITPPPYTQAQLRVKVQNCKAFVPHIGSNALVAYFVAPLVAGHPPGPLKAVAVPVASVVVVVVAEEPEAPLFVGF